jgi:hypothetical protein
MGATASVLLLPLTCAERSDIIVLRPERGFSNIMAEPLGN